MLNVCKPKTSKECVCVGGGGAGWESLAYKTRQPVKKLPK